jgi:hypothetical protein
MNKIRFERWSGLVVCVGLFFALHGCAALVAGGAAGGATYVYTEGWVEREYKVGLDQAYNASLRAAENQGMTVSEKSKEVASADIKAKKEDKDYWIKIKESSENRTTVSVRSGIMGDKESSQKIHEEIGKLL